jgi:NAD(P)-dependent dehydrogenase (short-subunit alcohol dehydrogenase family)
VLSQPHEENVARIFITGSTDGLGRAAAQTLLEQGHQVVFHARSKERAAALTELAPLASGLIIGDLGNAEEVRSIADQVNAIGGMDAVIHNAGVYRLLSRDPTPEGHARTLAVNALAPYMLTALIKRPPRLIYLSSGMHRSGNSSLHDIDWTARSWDATAAYCESKLYITTLAFAVGRKWRDTLSHAVDPGWVATKMGGPGAPGDLVLGRRTQTWLAVSDDPAATQTGGYWHHQQRRPPAEETNDPDFQDRLMAKLANLTGVALFRD